MLSKEAATDTEDQLKANAFKYFTSLFVRPEAKDITINVGYTTEGGSKIVINATAAMPADFTKLLGYDNFTILASSTAKWGTRRLRVALVLDNTGSMADDGKMAALQSATKGLLTQLQGAVNIAGDVYVSIIPFVKDVNLGGANWNSDWIYWGSIAQDPDQSDNTSWEALNGVCSNTTYNNNRSNCFTRGGVCSNTSFTRQSTCTTNGTCSVGSPTSQTTCNARGTCSISGNTTQSACNSAGTCSLSSYTTQTDLPECRNLQHLGLRPHRAVPERARLLDRGLEHQELNARTTVAPGWPVCGPLTRAPGRPLLGLRQPSRRTSGRPEPGRPTRTIRGTAASWTVAIRWHPAISAG